MIKSIQLHRFKNFLSETLPFGPFTMIVGTNASGKSNLRDAIRFVHGVSRGYSLAEIIGEKYVEGGVLQWKGIRGGIREASYFGFADFELGTEIVKYWNPRRNGHTTKKQILFHHSIHIDLANPNVGPVVIHERFSDSGSLIFGSYLSDEFPDHAHTEEITIDLPSKGKIKNVEKRLNFNSHIPVISQFPKRKDVSMSDRGPTEEFVEELQSMRFLDLSPDAMRTPSIPGQTVLGDRGENLSSVLQAICSDPVLKNALSEWVRQLTPIDVVDFEFVPDQTGRVLVSLVEANGQKTSAYSASDGTLRFLAMIAALMGPDSAKFYFLEEIDNGIHPTRLGLLLQLIEQYTREGKVQIVATTHSPQMLAMLSPESREHAILVYRLAGAQDAHIQRIMDIPSARQVLLQQNLARLHESGWLENAMEFSQPEETQT